MLAWNDRQTLIVGGTSRLDKVSSRNWMALLEATKSRRAEDNSGDPRHLCTRATGYPPILGHPGHRLHVVFDWSAAWKGVDFKAAAGRGDVGGEREGQVVGGRFLLLGRSGMSMRFECILFPQK